MDDKELKRKWRNYFAEGRRQFEAWLASGCDENMTPTHPALPEELRDMRCGAKTRAGTPCQRRDLCNSGRCRLHGGMSTGPRTNIGKIRSSMNGLITKNKRTP